MDAPRQELHPILSPRASFLLLLFANLAFFGWAELIDVPPEPPPSDSISRLPQLKLLSEAREAPAPAQSETGGASSSAGTRSSSGGSPSSAGASRSADSADAVDSPAGPTTPGGAKPGRTPPSGDAVRGGAPVSTRPRSGGPMMVAARGADAGPAPDPATADATSHRCVTVGPFTDQEHAREAMDLLRQRGFSPQPRAAPSGPLRGYWVFIGGLKSAADESRTVRRLERNGISDAKAMPISEGGGHRVSVGLFSARDGAERRARAVRRLGLDAEITPRQADLAHWVDVDLDSSGQSLPAEGLLSLKESGSQLEIKACPGVKEGGNGSRGRGTSGSKGAPAAPAPPAKAPDFNPQIPNPLTAQGRPRPG